MRLILLFFSSRFDKNWPIYNIFNISSFLLRSLTYSNITHIRLLYMEYIKPFANYWLISPQSKNCDIHEGSTLWDRSCLSPLLSHATKFPHCCCIIFYFSNTFFSINQHLSIIRIYDLIIPPNRFFNELTSSHWYKFLHDYIYPCIYLYKKTISPSYLIRLSRGAF
jgi:hypothetical protein